MDHEEEKDIEEGETMIELDLEEGAGEEDGEDVFGSLLDDGE